MVGVKLKPKTPKQHVLSQNHSTKTNVQSTDTTPNKMEQNTSLPLNTKPYKQKGLSHDSRDQNRFQSNT